MIELEEPQRQLERSVSGLLDSYEVARGSQGSARRKSLATSPTWPAGDGVPALKAACKTRRCMPSRGLHSSAAGNGKRRVGENTGAFAALPAELLEVVLLRCGAAELAALASTSRYWAHSGLVARAAATLLARTERGVRLASLYDGAVVPTVRLLCFQERCVAAALASSKLSLGSYHTAAVLRSAAGGPPRLHTFGRGFHGQLGRGGYDNATAPTPVAVPVDASLLASVACGSSHSAVLNSDGAVWTWGLASSGELGHGGWTPIEVDVPRCISALVGKVRVKRVVTGANHTLAVSSCGSLWACGRGRCGQLGSGNFNDAGPLLRIEALRAADVVTAAAGFSHSLALTGSGEVWSFGTARDGRLGQGPEVVAAVAWEPGAPVPARMLLPEWCATDPVVDVSAGGHHSLLRTNSGRLLVCGRGRHGALGVGDAEDRLAPVEVCLQCAETGCMCCGGGSRHGRVVAIAAGRDHTVVLTACGAVFCTGFNGHGQLGTGCTTSSLLFVRPMLPREVRIVAVAAGEGHSAAVSDDGTLYMWGRGDWGQLGSGDYRSCWRPTPLEDYSLAA